MRAWVIAKTTDLELVSQVEHLVSTLGFETERTEDAEGIPDLTVAIVDQDVDVVVRHIRADMLEMPLLVIVDADLRPAAIAAGADDALDRDSLALASLSRAVRWACDRRSLKNIEIHLLRVMEDYGQSLAVEGLDDIGDRVLAGILERLPAEAGILAFEWEWRGISDRVVRGRNLGDGSQREEQEQTLAKLLEDRSLSPMIAAPGIHELEASAEHPYRSALVVEIAPKRNWGRGGIAVFSRETEVFSQLDRRMASTMAGWAGVAFRQASSKRDLERAVRVRERVLEVASHDLRTPLSVFSMTTELMADTDDAAERAALRDRAMRSVEIMRRLTSDILDFAAIDSGKLRIQRSRVMASALATRAVEQSKLGSRKKVAEIELDVGDEVELEVDAGRIGQALTNLIDNALKFTPATGKIRVSVSSNERACTFSVADDGPGIPEDLQRKLFRRYESTSVAKQGVGLGLSIAMGIAEAHGGSIFVESSVGEGATFRLTVPRSSVAI